MDSADVENTQQMSGFHQFGGAKDVFHNFVDVYVSTKSVRGLINFIDATDKKMRDMIMKRYGGYRGLFLKMFPWPGIAKGLHALEEIIKKENMKVNLETLYRKMLLISGKAYTAIVRNLNNFETKFFQNLRGFQRSTDTPAKKAGLRHHILGATVDGAKFSYDATTGLVKLRYYMIEYGKGSNILFNGYREAYIDIFEDYEDIRHMLNIPKNFLLIDIISNFPPKTQILLRAQKILVLIDDSTENFEKQLQNVEQCIQCNNTSTSLKKETTNASHVFCNTKCQAQFYSKSSKINIL